LLADRPRFGAASGRDQQGQAQSRTR
jgi:hypothetical protein